MHFEPEEIHHIYNRGNENQTIFFNKANYLFFLKKVRKELLPYADILAYCLLPNQFHFIIKVRLVGCTYVTLKDKVTHLQYLSKSIGKTLSSYTQAINIERNRTGALFQKKTRAKNLSACDRLYLLQCVHYVHSYPVALGLVQHEGNWEFSSFQDYHSLRKGTLCRRDLFYEIGSITEKEFPEALNITEENIGIYF